jgi:hypothetical protein
MTPNAKLTGRRSPKRAGNPQAQLVGGPVERRVGTDNNIANPQR